MRRRRGCRCVRDEGWSQGCCDGLKGASHCKIPSNLAPNGQNYFDPDVRSQLGVQRRASCSGWAVVAPRQAAPVGGDGDGGAKRSGWWRRRHVVGRACIAMCCRETGGRERWREGNASGDLTRWRAVGRNVLASERRRFFISSRKCGTWGRSGTRVACWSVENGVGAPTSRPPLNGLPPLPHAHQPSPPHLNTQKHSGYETYDSRSLPGPSTAARGAGPHPPAEESVGDRPW